MLSRRVKLLSCTETWQVSSHQPPDQEVKADPFSLIWISLMYLFNICLPITGKMIPEPICAQRDHYPTSKHTCTNYNPLLQPWMTCHWHTPPLPKHNPVVGICWRVTLLDISYRSTYWGGEVWGEKWRARRLVLHCDLHWSQIWDAILGDKGKAPGMLVWRRGNRERFQKDEVPRQARVWRCGFAEN